VLPRGGDNVPRSGADFDTAHLPDLSGHRTGRPRRHWTRRPEANRFTRKTLVGITGSGHPLCAQLIDGHRLARVPISRLRSRQKANPAVAEALAEMGINVSAEAPKMLTSGDERREPARRPGPDLLPSSLPFRLIDTESSPNILPRDCRPSPG
jgi:hypothetical protein